MGVENMTIFKDHFSKHSDIYAKYRPHYPVALYSYLSSITKDHALVWDCGTGNGQAAIGLASFYDMVIATDPSEQQIMNSIKNEKIKYRIEKAENCSIESNSVDLVVVANVLHWLEFESFYKQVNRVLKQNGVIAVMAYGLPSISREIDVIIKHFHDHTLNDYWLAENRLVENEYVDVPFPFQEISNPEFSCEKNMNLDDLIGYLSTWSATQRFINENKFNPTEELRVKMKEAWKNNPSEMTVTWKLILKIGTTS